MNKVLKKPTYEDTDIIKFGKHKGEQLSDVPVSYLHWWYHNTDTSCNLSLKHYIENNLDALKMESRDLIWEIQK